MPLPDPDDDLLALIERLKGPKPADPVAEPEIVIEQDVCIVFSSFCCLILHLGLDIDLFWFFGFLVFLRAQKSPLLDLPFEVTSHILDYLPPSQLANTSLICRTMRALSEDPWVVR